MNRRGFLGAMAGAAVAKYWPARTMVDTRIALDGAAIARRTSEVQAAGFTVNHAITESTAGRIVGELTVQQEHLKKVRDVLRKQGWPRHG
jgi:hypothetical protein